MGAGSVPALIFARMTSETSCAMGAASRARFIRRSAVGRQYRASTESAPASDDLESKVMLCIPGMRAALLADLQAIPGGNLCVPCASMRPYVAREDVLRAIREL